MSVSLRRATSRALAPALATAISGVALVAAVPAAAAPTGPGIPPPSPVIDVREYESRLARAWDFLAGKEVVNVASGLRADVGGAPQTPGAGVVLWHNNASPSQEFMILRGRDGSFRLRARHSGQCLMLDWTSGPYRNGTRIVQHPDCRAEYAPAQWRVRTISRPCPPMAFCPPPATLLVNKATGRCLDASNPPPRAPRPLTVLNQWECATSASSPQLVNQDWRFDPAGPPPPPLIIN